MSRSSDLRRRWLPVVALGLATAACSPTPPLPTATKTQLAVASPVAPTSRPTPAPTHAIDISCTPATVDFPALRGDPCPGAVTAVELAVAPVRLPIDRIVIEPGPFYCDVVWPGAQSPASCYGVLVIPGQYMHAWATFDRSDEVAAVMLGRDLPRDLQAPASKPIAWNATLVTVGLPPAGWRVP